MKNQQSQTWAITLFTVGVFMAGLDNGIISTALTLIYDSYGVSPVLGAWTVTIYTLGLAVSTPIIGKLSDRYGRKRMFLVEITLFGIGSLFVALSPNFVFLLFARFLQAIGGGGIFIIGSSYILSALPKGKQGKALGLLGGMHGLSAVIGPNLGAAILSITGTWHWMFLINIPIAILLIVFGWIKLEETKPGSEKALDVFGSILLSIAILIFMLGITAWNHGNIQHWRVLTLLIGGMVLFVLFLLYERKLENKAGDPILPFTLLKSHLFILTLLLGLLSGGFLAGIIYIPSFVQEVLQVPVEQAGYWVTPLALAAGAGAGIGGALADKKGPVNAVIISGVISIIGFGMFAFFVTGALTFIIASLLAGVGFGMLLGAPLNMLAGKSAKEGQQGTAVGTLSLIRQIGLTLFPTIYAGFITAAFVKITPNIQVEYGISLPDSVGSYSEVKEAIQRVDDSVQTEIFATISEIIQAGYTNMFLVAMIASVVVVLLGFYLRWKKV